MKKTRNGFIKSTWLSDNHESKKMLTYIITRVQQMENIKQLHAHYLLKIL